jgi:hypothetical protein
MADARRAAIVLGGLLLILLSAACGGPFAPAGGAERGDGRSAGGRGHGADKRTVVPPAGRGRPYPIRGIYGRDTARQSELGFNFIDSPPDPALIDDLDRQGLKGFVWLGGYSNDSCSFNESDAWVRSRVAQVAGHRGVGAYFVDDEPNAAKCPGAPRQMHARSRLVKSIDPRPPTFIAAYKVEQFKLFAGTVDVLALDRYPCTFKYGCDYGRIDQAVAEADRLGVRYWGVVQAHGDDWYRQPTPAEMDAQFRRWRATRMEGYLVFAWRWPSDEPRRWLANNGALQAQLKEENRVGRP